MEYSYNRIEPYLYSCHDIIKFVNTEFIDLSGFSSDELLGKSLLEIGELLKISSQVLLSNIESNFHGFIFTKRLEVREVNISFFKGKNINKKIYTFVEKENSKLHDKLVFVEQTFNENQIGAAIYSVPDLILLKANRRYIDFIDAPFNKEQNSIGRAIKEFTPNFAGSHSEFFWNSILKKQKLIRMEELKFERAASGITYLDCTGIPIFVNGKMKYVFKTTAEVNPNIAIEGVLKSQEEFFANISHELKTPLNVIFATAQLLNLYCSMGSLEENKESVLKYIHSIKQNCYRLSKLINNIVDSSKIKEGYFELKFSNNNIVEVVEEIVMSVTNFTEIKGLNIIFDTDTEEIIIACDPEKIERIFLNLISNAIKFSDVGGEIFVDVKNRGGDVEISVKDNGIGIEADDLDMIFERFRQVDKALSRNAEGTGIGLSLVKSMVELHGGSISVESEFGKGSKFTVILPGKRVMQENMIFSSSIRNKNESIEVELSDIYLKRV